MRVEGTDIIIEGKPCDNPNCENGQEHAIGLNYLPCSSCHGWGVTPSTGDQMAVRLRSVLGTVDRGRVPYLREPAAPCIDVAARRGRRDGMITLEEEHPSGTYLDDYERVWIGDKWDIGCSGNVYDLYRKANYVTWAHDMAVLLALASDQEGAEVRTLGLDEDGETR